MVNKKYFKIISIGFAVLFLLLYSGRVVYEFKLGNSITSSGFVQNTNVNDEASFVQSRKMNNYASLKMEFNNLETGQAQVVDQKYEKVATLSSYTTKYDEDEIKINNIIKDNKAVIQLENKRGLTGNRSSEMVIGVRPDQFDMTVKEIAKIGKLISTTVTKTDKTSEYRQMLADKATLEKTKESYIGLRAKSGSITELLTLEQKIIEIEGQIQKQSVDLGGYSDDNAFCTVNFTLHEQVGRSASFNTIRIFWNALKWTSLLYIGIIGIILFSLISVLILLVLIKHGKKLVKDLFRNSENTVSKDI